MKMTFKIHHGQLCPVDGETRAKFDKFKEGAYYEVDIKNLDVRTIKQNRLIHQFCENISAELQKQGIHLNNVLKHDTPVSMMAVKELMFKSVVQSLYGKSSTTKLNKNELNLVFDTLILFLSAKGLDTDTLIKT